MKRICRKQQCGSAGTLPNPVRRGMGRVLTCSRGTRRAVTDPTPAASSTAASFARLRHGGPLQAQRCRSRRCLEHLAGNNLFGDTGLRGTADVAWYDISRYQYRMGRCYSRAVSNRTDHTSRHGLSIYKTGFHCFWDARSSPTATVGTLGDT